MVSYLNRVVLLCSILLIGSTVLEASTLNKPRIVNKNGHQINSIFTGISPLPWLPPDYYKVALKSRAYTQSCQVRNAVFRSSDHAKFLKAQSLGDCVSHYIFDENRICGSTCGGDENWVYVDSTSAPWCNGYTWAQDACATGNCREEFQCYSNSPDCTG